MVVNSNEGNSKGSIERQQIIQIFDGLVSLTPARREATWQHLRGLDRENLFDILSGLVASETKYRYVAALAGLEVDKDRGINLVLPLLTDSDTEMRFNAAGLLSAFPHDRSVESLIRVLQDEPNGTVRHIAAFALGKIGNPLALSALRRTQADDDGTDFEGHPIRQIAAEAIEDIVARQTKPPYDSSD